MRTHPERASAPGSSTLTLKERSGERVRGSTEGREEREETESVEFGVGTKQSDDGREL